MVPPYGEEFDEVRGDPHTLLYGFKSSPLGSGRYLWAFTARQDLAIIRQHTRTKNGLKEIALGFDSEQLKELQKLIPQILKEMKTGKTSDEDVEKARGKNSERIDAMEDGAVKTALKNITKVLRRS